MTTETLGQLRKALAGIDRPGSFCVQGTVPTVLPGLEVKRLGPIAFPLTAAQANELKKRCEQAPHGKGTKTIVDTKVRRVWRLAPEHFTLTNPEWDRIVGAIVAKVQEVLGLEKQKLESHLYDLLLYEPGSFFLPHRDGEKLDRMVATLVIVLPSAHEGGELIVRHDGQEQTIDFGSVDDPSFPIQFAAFYADCEHEVRPLRTGHRLCLVYNLTLAKSKKPIGAPRDSDHVERISELLRQWSSDAASQKLAITLDHQYTQDGLAWDTLKGVDRAKARIIMEAAGRADCHAYLALLTFWESGSAVDDGSSYGYGRRRRWYEDDEEEEEDEGTGEHEMDEVFDSSLTAEHWCDSQGKRLPLGKLHLEQSDLLDPDALRAVDPEEDYEGYTGNAGMTLERWYRHAAIILWPARRHFEMLCDRAGQDAVPMLAEMMAQQRHPGRSAKTSRARPASPDPAAATCLDLASAIITKWREQPHAQSYPPAPKTPNLLPMLTTLGDPQLIRRFLAEVMVKDVTVDPDKSIVTVCRKYGWETFIHELLSLMKQTNPETAERNVRLLEHLCVASPGKGDEWLEFCQALAGQLVGALESIDREKPAFDWRSRKIDRSALLAGLARALITAGQTELLSRVVTHALALPEKYPLTEAHVNALIALGPWLKKTVKKADPALSSWLTACRGQLEVRTAQPPEDPADFRRPAKLTCHCKDCGDLRRFLEDPDEPVYRFGAAETRRKHLESAIRMNHCDVSCKTERRGSPHTLVCTKNKASYQAKLKTYHEELKQLAAVRALEARLRR